ncbi:MAG: hypothetical protein U0573_01670 [Phycisphaerales bacterium]|nr:hypothetical protein [Planctomycetota bacterium]
MFKDVTRERAKSVTRGGQIAAVALASLAGVVFAVGLPGLAVPKIERPAALEPMKPAEPANSTESPVVSERRASAIASNLAQLGNHPKPPPEVAAEGGDESGQVPEPLPVAPPNEMAVTYLGRLGSESHPMALVSIESHQQVLAVGDVVHKSSGESVKLVKVEKDAIEIEMKGASRKIDLAPKSGPAFTSLQASPANPAPAPANSAAPNGGPPVPAFNRGNRNSEMRPPGMRPGRGNFRDESGSQPRE